jgi:hypothetical protein
MTVRGAAVVTGAVSVFVLAGCGSPSGEGDYHSQLANTSKTLVSAIVTAKAAVRLHLTGALPETTVDTILGDAEQDVDSAGRSVRGRSPPGEQARARQRCVYAALAVTTSALAKLRTAAQDEDRAGERQALDRLDAPLAQFRQLRVEYQ